MCRRSSTDKGWPAEEIARDTANIRWEPHTALAIHLVTKAIICAIVEVPAAQPFHRPRCLLARRHIAQWVEMTAN